MSDVPGAVAKNAENPPVEGAVNAAAAAVPPAGTPTTPPPSGAAGPATPGGAGAALPKYHAIPICMKDVESCLESAGFWVAELPRYADRNQKKADAWAIASGILAAITSLAIWPAVAENSATWATVLVSAVALAAAVCALLPRVKGYSELAGQARELAGRYGPIYGHLLNLSKAGPGFDQAAARDVVTEFETIKAKKDTLRDLPDKQIVMAKRALLQAQGRKIRV